MKTGLVVGIQNKGYQYVITKMWHRANAATLRVITEDGGLGEKFSKVPCDLLDRVPFSKQSKIVKNRYGIQGNLSMRARMRHC